MRQTIKPAGSRLVPIAVAASLALIMGACGSSAGSPTTTAREHAPSSIAGKGKLVACVDPTVPPMEFFAEDDSNNPVGFDVDMIKEVADSWGVEADIKVLEFSGLLPGLSGGTCDVVWSAIFILPDRVTGEFNAIPYLNSGPVLMVPAGNPDDITSPEDLSGLNVVTQSGTNFPGMLDDLNAELKAAGKEPAKYQEYPGANEAAQQVIIGRAQAFLGLDADGSARVHDDQFDWEIAYVYPKDLQYGVYYMKDDAELGDALETEITELVRSGTMKAALEKWQLPTDAMVAVD